MKVCLKFDATNMQKVGPELILSGEIKQMFDFLRQLGLSVVAAAVRREVWVAKTQIVWWDGYLLCEPVAA